MSEATGVLRGLIPDANWHTAKYLSDVAPHQYIRKHEEPDLASKFISAIGEHGVNEEFTIYGRTKIYRYLYLDGWKYWYIDPVVNRANSEARKGKDG